MSVTIRPIVAQDYAAIASYMPAAMPGTDDTAESLYEDDTSTAAFERWVAVSDGHVVGSASWFQSPSRFHPQKFWMDGAVHPEFQRQGIGSLLFATVLAAIAPKTPISLRTFSREDYGNTLRFLDKHGFVEAKRTWESYLDLSRFDFEPYSDQAGRGGIRLCALSELQRTADWKQRLLDLYNAIQVDIPDIDPAVPIDMESLEKKQLASSTFLPDGQYIALDGDRWVGMSALWKGTDDSHLNTGLTGVLPAYRRRGIAMALKLQCLAWARRQGIARVRTTNASTNVGMLTINERLGFIKAPAWIHLIRYFQA